jgi:hypothetical protein
MAQRGCGCEEKSLRNLNMQEKRNKKLAGLALSLALTIGAVYWAGLRDESYRPDKNLFRDIEIELVDKVILRSKKDSVTLKYTGSGWNVNEIHAADRSRIMVLFATLQQAEPKRPVASSLKDSISRAMESDGIDVLLFIGDEVVQELIVGGSPAKTETYFKKKGIDDPYVMSIPGYRTYVGGIFELDENGWRDRHIFRFNWENFRSLESRFKNATGDFSVVMNNHVATIPEVALADTAKLNQYMDYLSLLAVDDYLDTNSMLDSLAKTQPVAEFAIEDIASRKYTLALYAPQYGKGVYALVNGTQWAVIQEDRIFPILRPKEFFVKR